MSVIIPVYDDFVRLRVCLARLEAQTYSKARYEILVVDNGSSQPVEDVAAGFAQVRILREPQPGSYRARNRGIEAAAGEVLAFTDSDCVPARDWIERGVERLLREPNCGLVAGRIDVFACGSVPTAVELHEQITAFPQRRYVEEHNYGATANVFTRRGVIDRVGPFNAKLKSSGDNEWGNRVSAAGYRLTYADEVRVAHPARRSFGEVYRKVTRLVGGQRDWRGSRARLWRELYFDLRPPVGLVFRAMRDARLPGPVHKLKFVAVEMFIRYTRALERARLSLGGASTRR